MHPPESRPPSPTTGPGSLRDCSARRGRRSALAAGLGLALAALAGCGPPAAPRDVVLIVVDTLRADHLGCYGHPRQTTPRLDRRAAGAALFERAFATSPWTLPTFGSLLTGELPSRHAAGGRLRESGWELSRRLDGSLPTLPERLAAAGYATAAFVNNPWLRPRFGLDRGFDLYDHRPGTNLRLRRADQMVDLALEWIDGRAGSRYFALVHLFDPHMTYDPPEATRGRFTAGFEGYRLPVAAPRRIRARAAEVTPAERAFIAAAYDEEIAFVDEQLDRLLGALEGRGRRAPLVVLTSDHGEELFDHESFEHGHTAHRELLHVPLLVWGPGVRPGRVAEPVSLVDLAPTVLEAVGLEPFPGAAGRSLWPAISGGHDLTARPAIAEATLYGPEQRAIVDWPLKLIVAEQSGRRSLYDLETDPAETIDLAPNRKEEADRLERRLEATLAAARAAATGEEFPLDEATRRELRSLGYLP